LRGGRFRASRILSSIMLGLCDEGETGSEEEDTGVMSEGYMNSFACTAAAADGVESVDRNPGI